MDRSGIFVDAGYLLAEAGDLCLGTKRRADIACDYAGIHSRLRAFAGEHSGLRTLRTYWYDAAPDGLPTAEHLSIANLPNLKLRLGRLSGGQQKGVDSLIIRDLMTLARERAVATAYLLGGDEDLREGVLAAQDLGVEVVLLGVPSRQGNQSQSLVREVDENLILDRDVLDEFFSPASFELPSRQSDPPVPATAPQTAVVPTEESASAIGRTYADNWAAAAGPDEVQQLVKSFPVIPKAIDAPLLREGERQLGSLRNHEPIRRTIRGAFQQRLAEIAVSRNEGPQ